MKLEHKKEFALRLNPVQFSNVSKEDNFMYRMGMKAGYRLALDQLNQSRKIVTIKDKAVYTTNNYKKVDVHKIAKPFIERVCKLLNVPQVQLLSVSRFRLYALPRSIIVNLLRNLTDLSTPQIGEAINRHHTTVLHHLRSKENKTLLWQEHKQKTYDIYKQLFSEFKSQNK